MFKEDSAPEEQDAIVEFFNNTPDSVEEQPLVQLNTNKLRRYWKKSSRYIIGGAAVVAGAVLYGLATSNRSADASETDTIDGDVLELTMVDNGDETYSIVNAQRYKSSASEESVDTTSESLED